MGRNLEEFRVTASLSSHNSEQDEIDRRLWEEIMDEVRELCRDPRFESIRPDVW